MVFNDRVLVSAAIVQQLQVRLEWENDRQTSAVAAPSLQVQDAFTGGGAQADVSRTERTLGLIDVVSWTHGRHYFRFGTSVPQLSRRVVGDQSNRLGTFSFLSLADDAAHRPNRYTVQQGRGRATYFATEAGAFVQDEVALRPNLHVTAGVRYQWQTYLNDGGNFAPRVSAAYAPAPRWCCGPVPVSFSTEPAAAFVTFKLHNGENLRQYQLLYPSYPDPLAGMPGLGALPNNLMMEPAGQGAVPGGRCRRASVIALAGRHMVQ